MSAKWICPDCREAPETSRVPCGQPPASVILARGTAARVRAAADDLASVAELVLATATIETPPALIAAAQKALKKAGKL